MSISILDVFNAFRDYFLSLDLRILAFKRMVNRDYQWINQVCSLFFSEESVEDIIAKQKSINRPKTENIRLFCNADTSSIFEKLSFGVSKGGVFRFNDTITSKEVAISMGIFDPRILTINVNPPYLNLIPDGKILGACCTVQELDRHDSWKLLDEMESLVIPLGFDDVYQWINNALGIRGFRKGDENSFIIGLPIKAKLNEPQAKKNIVTFSVKSHKNIPDLQVNLLQWEWDPRRAEYITIDRKPKRLTHLEKQNDNYVIYADEVNFSLIHPKHLIKVYLISNKLPQLRIDDKTCRPSLENTLEPLIKAMGEFYSLEQFQEQLLNPEKIIPKEKRIEKDPSWLFEEAISWLLSLGGLSVIRLGEKEYIHLDYGENLSADIIAYKENDYLFIIDCDIRHVDVTKANNLLRIVDYFKPIQNEIGKPKIIPVIFTPKEPITSEIQRKVQVVDGPMIKRLLERAIEGDIDGFCSILCLSMSAQQPR